MQIKHQLVLPRTAVVFVSLFLHSIKSHHTFHLQETPANEAEAEQVQDYVVFRFFKMFEMICITSHHAFNLQETLADQAPAGTAKDCCGVRVFVVAQHQITPYISYTGDPCK